MRGRCSGCRHGSCRLRTASWRRQDRSAPRRALAGDRPVDRGWRRSGTITAAALPEHDPTVPDLIVLNDVDHQSVFIRSDDAPGPERPRAPRFTAARIAVASICLSE
ncbi:hypothetical protein Acry_2419 [Acidiphilium cryptum JF-5]|uniref:Uncharacterized protein n=1 Tax=Acidiphilium cryptum (strain JF-5) TaxID=349163 RepID=A5G181_ACICJ|nr:hypothetical protein Acry_2419 [Acidiphilium cryptum JF-5]